MGGGDKVSGICQSLFYLFSTQNIHFKLNIWNFKYFSSDWNVKHWECHFLCVFLWSQKFTKNGWNFIQLRWESTWRVLVILSGCGFGSTLKYKRYIGKFKKSRLNRGLMRIRGILSWVENTGQRILFAVIIRTSVGPESISLEDPYKLQTDRIWELPGSGYSRLIRPVNLVE